MPSVETLMTRDPLCCTPDETAQGGARKMAREDVGVLPLVESRDTRRLVGVVTDRDLCLRVLAEGRDPAVCTLGEVMSEDLVTVRESDPLDVAIQLMQQHQLRRVLVVDEHFACVGVLSQADLATHLEAPLVGRTVAEISRPE